MNATIDPRAIVAAKNNADWYAMMCDVHGLRYLRDANGFRALDRPPPYHSWMTVTAPDANAGVVPNERPYGVKDAYDRLGLDQLGFDLLFKARWIWAGSKPGAPDRWEVVRTPDKLARWETAWSATSPSDQVQFPASILARDDVTIWGLPGEGGFVAGVIANLSPDCIGLSNSFGKDALAAGRALASAQVPGLPLVGYGAAATLQAAHAAGFDDAGPLSIWVCP